MCLGVPWGVHDDAGLRMVTVDFGGVRREVCLDCTPAANTGTYEARRTLQVLRETADAVVTESGEPLA